MRPKAARGSQALKVVRNRGNAHAERGSNVADTGIMFFRKQKQDADAHWIGRGKEEPRGFADPRNFAPIVSACPIPRTPHEGGMFKLSIERLRLSKRKELRVRHEKPEELALIKANHELAVNVNHRHAELS